MPAFSGVGLAVPVLPTPSLTPANLAPAPSIQIPAPAAQGGLPRATLAVRLRRRFAALDRTFPLPAASPAARVRRHIRAELLSAARVIPEADANLLETVADEADRALVSIQRRLDANGIDTALELRVNPAAAPVAPHSRPIKIGIYPVAADPFHWGHLIVALRAIGDLGLDKVVFVLAGDDPRKPAMTPVLDRHPMGREVLDKFSPFFAYSPIAVGTQFDGETNIFRILELNAGVPVVAWYMVGDDHYRRTDKKGNPDTLHKLEVNRETTPGYDSALHQLKVAFLAREHPTEPVSTSLDVRFIEHAGFNASSTSGREGSHGLIPHTAIKYARRKGLYGLGKPGPQ